MQGRVPEEPEPRGHSWGAGPGVGGPALPADTLREQDGQNKAACLRGESSAGDRRAGSERVRADKPPTHTWGRGSLEGVGTLETAHVQPWRTGGRSCLVQRGQVPAALKPHQHEP